MNTCDCQSHYYDTFSTTQNVICQICHYSCLNCNAAGSSACTSCYATTVNNRATTLSTNKCLCNAGWYDDGSLLFCRRCYLTCQTCSAGYIYSC